MREKLASLILAISFVGVPLLGIQSILAQDPPVKTSPEAVDSEDIVADFPVSWSVNSIEIAWEVKENTSTSTTETTTVNKSSGSTYSKKWDAGVAGKSTVGGGIAGKGDLNANPFKAFGLFDSGVSSRFNASCDFSATGGTSWGKGYQEQAEESLNVLNSYNTNMQISAPKLTFSITFHNYSNKNLTLKVAPVPVLVGGNHLADAEVGAAYSAVRGGITIPANRPAGIPISFVASLDNTKARGLLESMKTAPPIIDIARSTLELLDDSGKEYISLVSNIESDSIPFEVGLGGNYSMTWRINPTRGLSKKAVTLAEVCEALNKCVQSLAKNSNKGKLFELSPDGKLVTVLKEPVFSVENGEVTMQSNATMNIPIENPVRIIAYRFPDSLKDTGIKALTGDAEAQNKLGECYESGKEGVPKDQIEAVKWYLKAAEQENAKAQHSLGHCYLNGIGVHKDEKKAFEWCTKAAEKGLPIAQCDLGYCYRDGVGVLKDEKKAFEWYTKAAEQGFAEAQYNLGCCYKYGTNVVKDVKKAVEWFTKGAEQGNANAQYSLGVFYQNGTGVPKDEEKAVELFTKAAERGNLLAQIELGLCYQNGTGVPKDEKKAVEWFKKAAEQGERHSQTELGFCYLNGIGVTKDEKKAVEWFTKAAEQEERESQTELGYCYLNGIGVTKDEKKAVYWYRKAADQGDEDAKESLRKLNR